MNDEKKGNHCQLARSLNSVLESELNSIDGRSGFMKRSGLDAPVTWIIAMLIIAFCTGCETQTGTALPEQPTAKTKVSLAPGDVIKLTFPGSPDFNQTQKIRADGKLSLPLVGEVTAAGKTLVDFQAEMVRLYQSQLRNSEVIVTLESGITQVVVSGNIKRPAKLAFDRPTTVFQAIMEAGGADEYGSLAKVHLIRVVNGQQLTQVLDLRPALAGKATSAMYVRDGDVIYVPQSAF
jgi:protein involved in polysaccharide export with SLBB domain